MAAKEGELTRDPDTHAVPLDTGDHRRASSPWAILNEFFRYGLVSAAALALDAALLKGLVSLIGWYYLPASIVSFLSGAILAYALSVKYVFRLRSSRRRTWELMCFVVLGVVGLLINSLVLSVAIGVVGLGLMTAKLVAAGFTLGTNFALRRRFLFSNARTSEWNELPSLPEQDPRG